MIRLGRQRSKEAEPEDDDLKNAVAHLLDLLARMARRGALGLDATELTRLRLQTLRATKAELEHVALNIQDLRPSLAGVPTADLGSVRVDGPDASAFAGEAARSSLAVARATGIEDADAGLNTLGQSAPLKPRPESFEKLNAELEQLAYAVLFLRQRGDVMHTSMSEVSTLLASLAEHEPAAVRKLEETQSKLASARSVGELEQLRENLVQSAAELVSEAKERVERSEEAGQMLRFHQAHQRVLELALDNATTMAETDALTGLGNRRALERSVTQLAKHGYEVGVVTIDLDHFKRVNDEHGHDAGDAVLKAMAGVLRAELRGADRAFRSGGEEFVALLPSTDLQGSVRTAERIRQAIEALIVHVGRGAKTLQVTGSFGVALWGSTTDYRSAAARSDKALYAAKKRGRNQVVAL